MLKDLHIISDIDGVLFDYIGALLHHSCSMIGGPLPTIDWASTYSAMAAIKDAYAEIGVYEEELKLAFGVSWEDGLNAAVDRDMLNPRWVLRDAVQAIISVCLDRTQRCSVEFASCRPRSIELRTYSFLQANIPLQSDISIGLTEIEKLHYVCKVARKKGRDTRVLYLEDAPQIVTALTALRDPPMPSNLAVIVPARPWNTAVAEVAHPQLQRVATITADLLLGTLND